MAFSHYLRHCGKNQPGVRPEFYMIEREHIASVTETAGEITAAIGMVSTAKFHKVQANLDSVQFTQTGEFSSSGAYEQELVCKFSKPRLALNTLIDEIKIGLACGLVAIYVDNNAQAWLFGASTGTKDGLTRPINRATIELDTGTLPTDEDGQNFTVTFKRMSSHDPVPFDSTVNDTIVKTTDAAFIQWSPA